MEMMATGHLGFVVKDLEAQHAALKAHADELLHSAGVDGGTDDWLAGFSELIRKLERHFQSEEDLMHRLGYPERLGHAQLHKVCLRQLGQLEREFQSGLRPLRVHLEEYLRIWIDRHQELQDSRFEAYLATRLSD